MSERKARIAELTTLVGETEGALSRLRKELSDLRVAEANEPFGVSVGDIVVRKSDGVRFAVTLLHLCGSSLWLKGRRIKKNGEEGKVEEHLYSDWMAEGA